MEGNKPFFIFDFDGTIADTGEIMLAIGNRLASNLRRPPLSADDIQFFRDFGAKEFIKRMKLSLFDVMRLLKKGNEIFISDPGVICPVPFMMEEIRSLKEYGAKVAIITSNSEEGVKKVIGDDISLFDYVIAERNLFGKAPKIRKMVRAAGASFEYSAYVGDEPRDIEAAKEAGVRSVAVLWGFGSKRSFMPLAPEFILSSPSELKEVFERLSS